MICNNTIITTKDLRTWNANILFISYFKKLRISDNTNIEKDIKKAIEMVADKLHNSYSICKKSYIDPEIIANIAKYK
jgi:DNA topoisomerase-1